jgi:cytochrome c556
MRPYIAIVAGLVAGSLFAASALAQEMKPEELLKARQGMMEAVRMQLGPIFGAAKGAVPLSAATAEAADNVVGLAHALKTAYGKGTEALPGSNALPEAFTDPKFMAGYDKLADAAAKVAADAKANNLDALKTDVNAIGGACKGCHDNFRKKS